MNVFSDAHNWQNDVNVKQILVFSSHDAMEKFTEKHQARRNACNDPEEVSDTGIGAMYKLRAIKNADGMWLSCVRCGFTGKNLWDGDPVATPKRALELAYARIYASAIHARDTFIEVLNKGVPA